MGEKKLSHDRCLRKDYSAAFGKCKPTFSLADCELAHLPVDHLYRAAQLFGRRGSSGIYHHAPLVILVLSVRAPTVSKAAQRAGRAGRPDCDVDTGNSNPPTCVFLYWPSEMQPISPPTPAGDFCGASDRP